MELLLVRHPRPLVDTGICYGSSDLAVAQDELTRVHASLRLPHAPVFSSPLQRCAALARLLSADVAFDANLAEMDFGAWEGRAWDDIPRREVDAWAADLLRYRPGGGENVFEVARRVACAMDTIRHHGTGTAIVICHAGTIRLMTALASGTPLAQAALAAAATPHQIAYGAVTRVWAGAGDGPMPV
ncbi:histidine phosphatase family protein [Pseudoduganella plicata]|uniref:Phosphoglycerate mutase n=1 Tax=Pseudoduganella plicata TaxID=321984 RepID=A0A4P7BH87_9BURK|nr:histidine phosphatase family protein [Pseudoduganella plicata]QBQ38176.1 phosphoglycerate mutase [Pseudoduganella plicata]GGZ11344.1 phosphoglycerate mutase [Pseudoduganella plicata]